MVVCVLNNGHWTKLIQIYAYRILLWCNMYYWINFLNWIFKRCVKNMWNTHFSSPLGWCWMDWETSHSGIVALCQSSKATDLSDPHAYTRYEAHTWSTKTQCSSNQRFKIKQFRFFSNMNLLPLQNTPATIWIMSQQTGLTIQMRFTLCYRPLL